MSDINDRVLKLEKEIEELRSLKVDDSKKKTQKKNITPRKPSEYNNFMGKFIADKKKELGDLYDHKKIFAEGAKKWKEQKN